MKPILIIVFVVASIGFSGIARAQSQCGPLANAYGPYDYRTNKAELVVVENFHFTPDIEQLKSSTAGANLEYTLRASPNHHRALLAMSNLAIRDKTQRPAGARGYTIDCYFERAMRFAGDDGVVRIIYGIYLFRTGKKQESATVLEEARRFEPANSNLEYNLGLVYLDLTNYPKALESAHKAYALGAQLPGLRNKLKAAGVWKEPPAGAPSAGASSTTGDRSSPRK